MYADLLLSMDTRSDKGIVAFEAVNETTTTDLLDGDPKLAYKTLVQKYQPKTGPGYIELLLEFTNCKLTSDEDDPDEWMTHLQSLQTRMNKVTIKGKNEKSEMDLILHILSDCPLSYEQQVADLEDKLKQDPDNVTISIVKEKFCSWYARLQKDWNEDSPANEKERALTAISDALKAMSQFCPAV